MALTIDAVPRLVYQDRDHLSLAKALYDEGPKDRVSDGDRIQP